MLNNYDVCVQFPYLKINRKILMTIKSIKCRLSQYCRKYKSIYDESIIYLSQIRFGFNWKHYQTMTISP